MKTISFTKPRKDKTLHIETPNGIVNITIGLTDTHGRSEVSHAKNL